MIIPALFWLVIASLAVGIIFGVAGAEREYTKE